MTRRQTHQAKLHDGIDIVLILLHFLPEANCLLQLQGVHVLGPAPLHVVNTPALHLEPLCVGLNTARPMGKEMSVLV